MDIKKNLRWYEPSRLLSELYSFLDIYLNNTNDYIVLPKLEFNFLTEPLFDICKRFPDGGAYFCDDDLKLYSVLNSYNDYKKENDKLDPRLNNNRLSRFEVTKEIISKDQFPIIKDLIIKIVHDKKYLFDQSSFELHYNLEWTNKNNLEWVNNNDQ
ncbi:unnamed protein product [Cunninghamella blakesleeana]